MNSDAALRGHCDEHDYPPIRLRIALASNEAVTGKGVLLTVEFDVQSGDTYQRAAQPH